MQRFIRFLSNSTYKNSNKELACLIKQSKQLVCFTNKQNKRSSEIIEYKRANKNNPTNRDYPTRRHDTYQSNKSNCITLGPANRPYKIIR
jgi:hypothetical protein